MRAALLLFLALSASAKKADDYAPLKPLYGAWLVDRDCRIMKDRVLVEIIRVPSAVRATYFTVDKKKNLGKSEIFYNAEAERYKIFSYFPGNQVTKALGVNAIPGALSFEQDEEDPERELIVVTGKVSSLSGRMEIKPRDGYKKLTFALRAQTPLGPQTCTGVGVKQPAAKKP